MPLLRAQVVLKAQSGMPKDNVVNTFHVLGANNSAAHAEAVAEKVRDFYVVDTPTTTEALSAKLSWHLATNGHEVRVYEINVDANVTEPYEGAPPIHVEVFSLLGRPAENSDLPSEVACCLSYRNTTNPSVPAARRRGRIYFGPLILTGQVAQGADHFSRPNATLTADLRAAGDKLKDDLTALNAPWVVYSRPYAGRGPEEKRRANGTFLPALPARGGAVYTVDQVWTDDAFDTQRRRGPAATARTYQS